MPHISVHDAAAEAVALGADYPATCRTRYSLASIKTAMTGHVDVRSTGSIKGEEPVSVTQVLAHKTSPNLMMFVNAGGYMW